MERHLDRVRPHPHQLPDLARREVGAVAKRDELAVASEGAEQKRAFAAATALNPLSPEIASWRDAAQGGGR